MEHNKQITIKVTLTKDNIRRLSVRSDEIDSFEKLRNILRKLYKTMTDEEFNTYDITYQDNESDWITISSDEELEEGLSLLEGHMFRITLRKNEKKVESKIKHCRRGMRGAWKRRREYFELHTQAMALMSGSTEDLLKARDLLLQQHLMAPLQDIPLYNLACAEALLGNEQKALYYLAKSVKAGYRDVDHLENDQDLISIRHCDEYKAIVASLRPIPSRASPAPVQPVPVPEPAPEPVQSPVPVPEPVPEPVPVPVQPVVVPPPVMFSAPVVIPPPVPVDPFADNIHVLEEMGWIDSQKNRQVLARANNDLVLAVQLLLDDQM